MEKCAFAALLCTALGCSPTLPPAAPHALVPPSPGARAVTACWIELATDHAPGDYGLNGGSQFEEWPITYSSLLLHHPRGDVLIDAGFGSDFDDEVRTSNLVARTFLHTLIDDAQRSATLPEALRGAGEDPSLLAGIVISHIHADHAGGALDVPNVPVYLAADELALLQAKRDAGGFDVVKAVADSILPRARPIVFSGAPYETFDRSFDFYGDGSIVLVPLPGHTPGSIGTFVNLGSVRVFHLGDATNTVEAVERRRGKSFGLAVTDDDGAQADATLEKIAQLHALEPNLVLLPAHDRRAWRGLFGVPGRTRMCAPPRAR